MKIYDIYFENEMISVKGGFLRFENDKTIIYKYEELQIDENETLRMKVEVAVVPVTALVVAREE